MLGERDDRVVGVLGGRGDGEVTLDQPGQRADQLRGDAADQLGAQEHRLDVPGRVVVGEDRLAEVLGGAGGVQVARGGEDRVDRVVGVGDAVAVGVDGPALERRGQELHPADGARGGDREVAAVVGLDLVDRGQHLPRHLVLDPGGLVDRDQERRDPERVDEEVRARRSAPAPAARARRSGCWCRGRPCPSAARPSSSLAFLWPHGVVGASVWGWVEGFCFLVGLPGSGVGAVLDYEVEVEVEVVRG